MNDLDFVDISGLDETTKLFRYLPSKFFLQMVEKRQNALAHVSKWDDPFEAFMFRERLDKRTDESLSIYDMYKHYYGQSWTLHGGESDLRWRAYCKRGDGVKISTTVRKLAESLFRIQPTGLLSSTCRIARVSYGDSPQVRRIEMPPEVAEKERLLAMFFMKRIEFSEEEEVRLMFSDEAYRIANEGGNSRCESVVLRWEDGMLKYVIDPTELIEEVVADPAMSSGRYEEMVCRCVNAGLPSGRINKSPLFERPIANESAEDYAKTCSSALRNREFWGLLQKKYPAGGVVNLVGRNLPYDTYWSGLPVGFSGLCFAFVFNRADTRVELYIGTCDAQNNKSILERLRPEQARLEKCMRDRGCAKFQVAFDPLDGKKAARISVRHVAENKTDNSASHIINWFCDVMPPFAEFMKKAVAEVMA